MLHCLSRHLQVLKGKPDEVFPRLWKEWGVSKLCFEVDTEPYAKQRDTKIRQLAKDAGIASGPRFAAEDRLRLGERVDVGVLQELRSSHESVTRCMIQKSSSSSTVGSLQHRCASLKNWSNLPESHPCLQLTRHRSSRQCQSRHRARTQPYLL